ncbi:hypothetical protein BJ166DRAFT_269609 [Pestalotiopsis sp. NC0098]|nr:hypothetical protein BJ166DRAFT_269609 [Pestalotiopsis sp. NC0098]
MNESNQYKRELRIKHVLFSRAVSTSQEHRRQTHQRRDSGQHGHWSATIETKGCGPWNPISRSCRSYGMSSLGALEHARHREAKRLCGRGLKDEKNVWHRNVPRFLIWLSGFPQDLLALPLSICRASIIGVLPLISPNTGAHLGIMLQTVSKDRWMTRILIMLASKLSPPCWKLHISRVGYMSTWQARLGEISSATNNDRPMHTFTGASHDNGELVLIMFVVSSSVSRGPPCWGTIIITVLYIRMLK